MTFTPQQQQAIAARGNVLVMAGAGTGKTRTLVERCLNILLEETPAVSLEEILMVTFTEAAAAEMRQRIRARLEEELAKSPGTFRWQEQLALFDTAHIGTLHGFCLQLVRKHFYELELDPQLAVLPEEEARLLADETLDAILQSHYAGDDALAEAVQGLIQTQGCGWDKPVRALVAKLHNYTQTLPDPARWLREQIEMFESPEPVQWRKWLADTLVEWTADSLTFLQPLAPENELAAKAVAVLRGGDAPSPKGERGALAAQFGDEGVAATLAQILEIPAACPRGKKARLLDPLGDFFDEADFLATLVRTNADSTPSPRQSGERAGERGSKLQTKTKNLLSPALSSLGGGEGEGIAPKASSASHEISAPDPLAEDWNWTRTNMLALLRLAEDFSLKFAEAKRELGALDFHDLEQHTLRLLWNGATSQPTPVAREWQKKLRFIFVDEYQDINTAQDKIIEALSRDYAAGNRFLVGDVKQSIYRFRLANPRIFQNYAATWHGETGLTIPLTENFRSREGVLDFANSLFELIMRPSAGGIAYDEDAKLRFGAPEERRALGGRENPEPRVELHLRLTGGESEAGSAPTEAEASVAELEEANQEARLVARRLRELKEQGHKIWDERLKDSRAVEWSDMAVLLRSPASKSEVYAKEFSQLGVPLSVARGGFFASVEISDLLSLLQLLDNPLQDLPALAVLHSPLVGLAVDELATIRLAASKVPFWTAVHRWHEIGKAESGKRKAEGTPVTFHASRITHHAPDTFEKVDRFLERFARWRKRIRQVSLSRGLEAILAETYYAEGLLTQPRGEQRRANVQRLLGLAQQFDQFQRQGLFRFLRFVEAQQAAELEPDVAAAPEENVVRLMSIHQSKGLEFPVVVVAQLAKAFNFSDVNADIILDEKFGLCPQIKPPQTGSRYPSLPHWLAARRQKIETLGEELRLLYVATTRARDTLILTASLTAKKFEEQWNDPAGAAARLLAARSFADWVGMWFAKNCLLEPERADGVGSGTGVPPVRTETHGRDARATTRFTDGGTELQAETKGILFPALSSLGGGEGEDGAHGVTRPTSFQTPLVRWTIHEVAALADAAATNTDPALPPEDFTADAEAAGELERRMTWAYPFQAATEKTAKVSVSTLRREAAEEEAERLEVSSFKFQVSRQQPGRNKKSAADIGTAHHKFLQLVALDQTGGVEELTREAGRLEQAGSLSAEEIDGLDFGALAAFWQSELGGKIRGQAGGVRRELAFTARFPARELAEVTGRPTALGDEFIVVQGVADLAVILETEIWLVDFKTDDVGGARLAEKVRDYTPQLKLYGLALARIYGRPVTQCWLHFLSARLTESVAV